jgi:hypothetical protein
VTAGGQAALFRRADADDQHLVAEQTLALDRRHAVLLDALPLVGEHGDRDVDLAVRTLGGVADLEHAADVHAAHAHGRPGPEPRHVGERRLVLELFGEELALLPNHENDAAEGHHARQHERADFVFAASPHDLF